MQCDKDNRYKRKKQIDMYLENIYSRDLEATISVIEQQNQMVTDTLNFLGEY